MFELFKFEVKVRDEIITQEYTNRFIENFLDVNSLFWGGGYNSEKLNGCISTENSEININSVIEGFVNYFNPRDEVLIKVYRQCFKAVEAHRLSRDNLVLTMIEEPN